MTGHKAASMNEIEKGIIRRYPMKWYLQIFNIAYGFLTLLIELLRRFYAKVILFWIKKDPYSTEILPLILEGHRYSYLGIGSECIVFRFWPIFIVKCNWENVKLDKRKKKIFLDPSTIVGIHHFGNSVNPITLSISAFSKLKLNDIADKINQT